MHVPTRSKHECKGSLKTVACFVTDTKQEENEDLTIHTKRLKQANDTFKQLVGEEWMNLFVEHTMECTSTTDATEQAKLKKEGPEKFAAFLHMKSSKVRKCGGPPSNLKEQCKSGSNQCPKMLRKVNDALTIHKWDNAWNAH